MKGDVYGLMYGGREKWEGNGMDGVSGRVGGKEH